MERDEEGNMGACTHIYHHSPFQIKAIKILKGWPTSTSWLMCHELICNYRVCGLPLLALPGLQSCFLMHEPFKDDRSTLAVAVVGVYYFCNVLKSRLQILSSTSKDITEV